MTQQLAAIALLVPDYGEAKQYYTEVLGFDLIEDTPQGPDKRWLVVRPPGSVCALLLAKASNAAQAARIGDQTGGRVFLLLHTDDFWRDYNAYIARGVAFRKTPRAEVYGTVAVFADRYGNLWDLIQRT